MTTQTKIFEGFSFQVSLLPDEWANAPGEDSDCHGPVKTVRRNYKKTPGEIILHSEHGTMWIYGWQEACRQARTAWGFTSRKDAAQAVQRDVAYLKGFLSGDWYYCLMTAALILDGKPLDHACASLGGLESNMAQEDFNSVANELCAEALAEAKQMYSNLGELLDERL